MLLLLFDVVRILRNAIPCSFILFKLSGNHVEPCVGFRDFFDAKGDHVAEVGFGADVGEVVLHGQTMGQRGFSVHNFLHFSSTFFRPGEWSLGTVSAPCKYHANHLGGGGGGGGGGG